MTCVNYNIIKDGDLRNIPSSELTLLGSEALTALYDGDYASTAATVSGSPSSVGVLVEFGESYDVCYVDYYTSETAIENIEINYSNTVSSGTLTTASLVEVVPGHFRATVSGIAYFVELRHTVSGTSADMRQLEVIARKNETLGFGTSKASEVDYVELPHATVGTLSASSTSIPLFNDNNFDDVALVSVAPTLTRVDSYIHIGTSSSGTFYGIDDYGFRQPGPNNIPLVDDPMNGTSLNPQWERNSASQAGTITATEEGLVFDLVFDSDISGTPSARTTGILSKEFFTATSFTAEVEIKFTGIIEEDSFNTEFRDFFFVLTNGYPIPEVGYHKNFQGDNRRATSTAGVALRPYSSGALPTTEEMLFMFRYADGWDTENPHVSETDYHFTGGGILGGHLGGPFDELGLLSLEDIWDINNGGVSLGDLDSAASWHKWKISYDHVRQELSGWVDNIFLGSRVFSEDSFKEGCKLFIGHWGVGGSTWLLRNFKIWPDRIYRQKNIAKVFNGGVASATISGTEENLSNLVDGDASTAYVGPSPDALTHIRVDFDDSYDVTYYTIKQRDQSTGTSAFSQTYYPDVARTALVNYGGTRQVVESYPNNNNVVLRAPTFSGTAVVSSGTEYVDFNFLSYDETPQPNGALVVEEIAVYAEDWVEVTTETDDSNKIPWIAGRWKNIKQYGSNTLALKYLVSPEASYWPFPEYFQNSANYGFSSAVNGRQFSTPEDYHHSEALFSSPGSTGGGDYTQWHSDAQAASNPFYIWRYFEEESTIGSVFFDSNTLRPSNVADKFKIQYLRDAGDPNNENDWADVPPVSVPYTSTSTEADILYGRYHDYLISNNDGEYYTDYYSLPDDSEGTTTGFSIGADFSLAGAISDPLVPKGESIGYTVPLNRGTANGLAAYVRFDEPVRTRGIRLLVDNPTRESGLEDVGITSTPGEVRDDFALEEFRMFRTEGAGVYTSPVFDTGTRQNTERLRANLVLPSGTDAAIFVRSHNSPPESSYNIEYETWKDVGDGGDSVTSFPLQPAAISRAVSLSGKIYYVLGSAPYVYDTSTDIWSQENGGYPGGTASTADAFSEDDAASLSSSPLLPDDRVYGNVAVFGNVVYVAAYNSGDARVPRIMVLDLSGAQEWTGLGDQRPLETEFSTMVGYNNRLYFFNMDGYVFYYDTVENNWVEITPGLPVYGGSRQYLTSAVYSDKIYIFGGSLTGKQSVDIFDPATEQFEVGTSAPKQMRSHQAIVVEEEGVIYVLPSEINSGSSAWAAMKYYPDKDTWEFAESLMWDRTNGGNWSIGRFYFRHDNYIYKVTNNNGIFRTLVTRPSWSHGQLPDFRDTVWGEVAAISEFPWQEIGSFGELMPQERYFQFKVELYSEDRVSSPVLKDIRIVSPQPVPIPASGTSNIYVRVGVSQEEAYQALYTGDVRSIAPVSEEGVYSILSSQSSNGLSWNYPTTASGAYDDGTYDVGASSAWAVKNSLTDYEVWYKKAFFGVTPPDSQMMYVTTSDLSSISTNLPSTAFTVGEVSGTEVDIDWPCVLKEGPSSYVMWYTGKDSSSTQRIFRAVSSDGISWSSHAEVIGIGEDVGLKDSASVYKATVIKESGIYKVWYTAKDSDGIERILYRESSDGISWGAIRLAIDVGSEGAIDSEGASRPYVMVDSSTYFMYYFGLLGGKYQCIRATSPDGLSWSNFSAALPPAGLQGTNDGDGIIDIFVLLNTTPVTPGEVLTTAQIKLHNEGASL